MARRLINATPATGAGGAATCNAFHGIVTTEALSDAAGAEGSYTINNNKVKAGDIVFVAVQNGTNTTDTVVIGCVTTTAGVITIKYSNQHAAAALNGTLKFGFIVVSADSG